MQGATIFVMYANGAGNVTISARDGNQGHVEPVPDATLQSGVTLLAGSGIVNGKMIANVHCTCPFPRWRMKQRTAKEEKEIVGNTWKGTGLTTTRLNMQTGLL